MRPAEKLKHIQLVAEADTIFEMKVFREVTGVSREFMPYVMDVVAVHD